MTSLERCDAAVACFKIMFQLLLTVGGHRRKSHGYGQGVGPKSNPCHSHYNAFRFTELFGRVVNQRILGNKISNMEILMIMCIVSAFLRNTL